MAAALWFSSLGSPLVAQTVATVELGPTYVEYDGFLGSGAAVFTPALQHTTANGTMGVQGTFVVFESGNTIAQAAAAGAWLTRSRGGWRGEFSGSVGAARYADEPVFGHVLARARAHYVGSAAGGWIGAATGGSFGDGLEVPVELAVGAWAVRDGFVLSGTITGSAVRGGGFVDAVGAARWSSAAVQLDAQAGTRPVNDLTGAESYGEVTVSVAVSERVRLSVSGGTYPTDPVRGTLGATYATLGIRVNFFGPPLRAVPRLSRVAVRAARALAAAASTGPAQLEVVGSVGATTLRVHVSDAVAVELMGDFTDWQPVPLRRIATGVWEVQLAIGSGVHRMNVRLNGGAWIVPAGVRSEETEFGGRVGVVVVP